MLFQLVMPTSILATNIQVYSIFVHYYSSHAKVRLRPMNKLLIKVFIVSSGANCVMVALEYRVKMAVHQLDQIRFNRNVQNLVDCGQLTTLATYTDPVFSPIGSSGH